MKNYLLVLFSLFLTLEAAQLNLPPVLKQDDESLHNLPRGKFVRTGPTVQIAILLDSSNSMDGLIAQAKQQIWDIVNEVSKANKENDDITMQVALYEYGKSKLPATTGYIQMLSPLTSDLDFLSENLFALQTDGGYEYAGEVIERATDELFWSKHPDDLKLIIIAGNENFDQGRVDYATSIDQARKENIIVNTIFCGSYSDGERLGWSDGAVRGGGKYLNINSNAQVTYIATPYDDEIIALNKKLNDTYIGYGQYGKKYKDRQLAEDEKNLAQSKGSFLSRAVSKSTKQYKTESWDAITAYEDGKTDIAKELKASNEEFADKSEQEINAQIAQNAQERKKIQSEILALEKKRKEYAKEHAAKENQTFGEKIIKEIKDQMTQSGYQFKR